jgi:tetratricopeptide (TPR) repeat protein
MISGKLKLAEEALKRAVTIAPNDAFSHSTLGIVYYIEGSRDLALQELNRALAIDPANAVARNYISIIRDGSKPVARTPIGDFDTRHERELRQVPTIDKLAPVGEIGLPASLSP